MRERETEETEIDISPKKTFRWPTRCMKRCSTSLIIREMQIKTNEVSLHTCQNGHKKSTNNKYERECGGKGIILHCCWECKLIELLWRTAWRFLKKQKIELHMTQQSHSWAYTQRKSYFKNAHARQCSLYHYLQ